MRPLAITPAERIGAAALAVPAVGVALIALPRYSGSAASFLFFNLCFVALALATIPRPRLYGYTILVALLVMGFWAKTMVHTLWQLSFLEPVGDFAGTPQQWDGALIAMSAAALGLLAARIAHLWWRRGRGEAAEVCAHAVCPAWFSEYRRAVWSLTLVAVIGVNAANLHFAFFQIGVNPKWLLPLRLHVLLAWLVNIGFALWIAALVWWDYQARPGSLRRALLAPFFESFLSSVSAFSRIAYLVHGASYWLALFEERRRLEKALARRATALLAAAFVLCFVASIMSVFWLRSTAYPRNADLGRNLKLEIPQLVVQRWVGLEGVLTVTSAPDRGASRLLAAMTDSPKSGRESLYQQVAKNRLQVDRTGTFTFLTNAGPVAILLFGGSLVVVFGGMALLMLVFVATEELANRWTGNPLLLAVAGAALANVISQTTFFYLTLVFLLQLWVTIAFLAGLGRLPLGAAAHPDPGAEGKDHQAHRG